MSIRFTIEPDITKDLLLSKRSQETYMEHYTGVPIKKGLFISPLRTDSKPTCAFYKNDRGDLLLKDFNGSFCGNFINVVMVKHHCDYHQALRIIANDFGIIKDESLRVNPALITYSGKVMDETKSSDIKVEIREFTKEDLQWWGSFGISHMTLKKFNVFSCKTVFLNCSIFTMNNDKSPIFGYYGGVKEDLEMWRIYMPFKRSYRFLSNWKKGMIQGAHMLPKSGELVVITKSMKDVMLLYELGIPAIAPNSESTFISEDQLRVLKTRFNNVVLFYDNDLAGVSSMNKFRKINNVKCIWLPRFASKDVSDFFKIHGKEKTQKLVEYGKKAICGKITDTEKKEIRELCSQERK